MSKIKVQAVEINVTKMNNEDYNPNSNYGEFATIRMQVLGDNSGRKLLK